MATKELIARYQLTLENNHQISLEVFQDSLTAQTFICFLCFSPFFVHTHDKAIAYTQATKIFYYLNEPQSDKFLTIYLALADIQEGGTKTK